MKKLWQALMLVRRCDKRSFRLRVLYVVLQSLLPLVNLYILKLLVDSVTAVATNSDTLSLYYSATLLLLLMVTVFLLNRVVSALNAVNNDVLGQRLVDYMADIMQRQSARLDMAYYDNPEYYDSLHRAQQEASSRPLVVLGNFMALFGSLISIAGIVAMLTSASWWVIVVMVLAVLPGFAVRLYKARRIYRFRRDNTQLYRRTSYYSSLLSSRAYAMEMRAYNLTGFFRTRFVQSRKALVTKLLRISRRLGTLDVLCGVIEAAAMFAVVWLLIQQAFAAAISVGTFVMLFEAFRRGQGYLSSLVSSIAALYDNRLFVGNLFDFLDFQPQIVSSAEPLPMPEKIQSVEFRDITFRYQDMQHDVLNHYNLVARVGEVTRIEGENGYGKSTLVKLLLRLYDPQQGAVLINGIDIRRFSLDDLRRTVGVMFQDFGRYALTAEENIQLSRTTHTTHSLQLRQVLSLSGALSFVDMLPQKESTLLGRTFDGGAELSMGQWQRIAFARLLHTDAPVMVLDEPVAWIDVAARQHINETIEKIKQDKIILIITHT